MHVSSYEILNSHKQSKLNSRTIYISLNQYKSDSEKTENLLCQPPKRLWVF